MKKILIVLAAIAFCAVSSTSVAQTDKSDNHKKKEVRMEDENGVKTLTITTYKDGVPTEERYTGEEAERKLAEEMQGHEATDGVRKEVKIDEVNGQKQLTVITSNDGKMKEEVFVGEEADAKLKELEEEEKRHEAVGNKTVVVKKTKKTSDK